MPLWFSTLSIFNLVSSLFNPQLHDPAVPALRGEPNRRVPVVLGVMSKCPDARDCESVFSDVLQEVGDMMDLQLTFIGTVNHTEPNYGVTCKHGSSECLLNIQELCIIDYYPFRQWWPFVLCVNSAGNPNEEAKACAERHGIDWILVEGCMIGKGRGLLMESVIETKELGITNSCTILINGRQRCIRDDAQWKECDGGARPKDFARSIRKEYDDINQL